MNWFRPPADGDPGTLNACYKALDIHVVRGRADDVALTIDGEERSFARLLTEVAACAGVLRAFGVGLGDRVVVAELSPENRVVVPLAVARVGAVAAYDNSPGAEGKVRVDAAGLRGRRRRGPLGRRDAGRAHRSCGLRRRARRRGHGHPRRRRPHRARGGRRVGRPRAAAPAGATLVEVGGVRFWSFDTA